MTIRRLLITPLNMLAWIVWADVARMRTLNSLQARQGRQMHLCPLQFDICDRIIERFSMPGETVYDPFGGLMTVPMRAVMKGRFGVGCELNPEYFTDGVAHCRAAVAKLNMPSLFDVADCEFSDVPLSTESQRTTEDTENDEAFSPCSPNELCGHTPRCPDHEDDIDEPENDAEYDEAANDAMYDVIRDELNRSRKTPAPPVDMDKAEATYEQAVEITTAEKRASVTLLQRRMGVGYAIAMYHIDRMIREGIVGDFEPGRVTRPVLITLEQWRKSRAAEGSVA
jgi:hypothetical protein